MEGLRQIQKIRLGGAEPMQEQEDPGRGGMWNQPAGNGNLIGRSQMQGLIGEADICGGDEGQVSGLADHRAGSKEGPDQAEETGAAQQKD